MNVKMLTDLSACKEAIDWFVENCKDNCSTEEAVDTLYKSNHTEAFEWSNWILTRLLTDVNKIKYAVFAARKVLSIFEKQYPDDLRPRLAIEGVEKFIYDGSEVNKDACAAAAYAADYAAANADAADAADAARAAAYAAVNADAAYAAYAAYAAAHAADAAAAYAAHAAASAAAAYAAAHADAAAYADITKKIIQYGLKLLKEQK